MLINYIKISTLAISLLYVDLFCGAGGTSTGVESAIIKGDKCAKVIACVNHDKNAIISHAENHPETLHFTEDIRTLDLTELLAHVETMKKLHPYSKLVLWASLECTNFSKAKGGLSRDADSRTLAEHLFRYIEALKPDCIQIENVEEFMSWGKMCDAGKPISKDKGRDFMRWVKNIQSHNYIYDYKILNSADFGAYTSRKRFFAQFANEDFPIVWPNQTHSKTIENSLFADVEKWKAVKDVLNFEDEGRSIFTRKKPLAEKTLERIYAGLIKFVAGGKDKFLSKYYSGKPQHKNISVDGPAHTIKTIDSHALVQTKFLSAYYGTGDNVSSVENPSPTITTKDRISKVECHFIDMQYGNGFPSDINLPANTITGNPKHNLVSCEKINKKYYLMNPQFNSAGGSIEKPAFTLIARMDKMPPYLVATEDGNYSIQVYSTDSPNMIKIKEFMAAFGIADIKMRMLNIPELKQIMGFPKTYVLIGTQAEQKKFIGNAVEVTIARKMCEATSQKIQELKFAV